MAFTSSQKNAIRLYLGGNFTAQQVDPRVKNAIEAVESLGDADLEARVVEVLGYLASIDEQLITGRARYKFKKVEDVEFNVGGEVGSLRTLGTIFVNRLATFIGCPLIRNPYSGAALGAVMRQG